MAKRSDFAQKLLDDLRLRKEKMGITPAGGRAAQSGNAQGNSQWTLRGSREATTNNFTSKNMANAEVTKIWLGTRHHKTPAYEGSSQDIVPFRKTTHVDVSMQLALALSKSGKLQNIEFFSNATIGKEHIMHHGSLQFREKNVRSMSGRPRHPTGQFPFFSHLQIDGVSKGVQQLNQILKACSNGLSFSRDSVDIGRELLKGAMDLEESLRMLVTLQEASDYMVGSQGRQVRLLEGKEDDESSTHEVNKRKLVNRPRFSFDEPPRNSYKLDREGSDVSFLDQNKLAVSHLEKPKTPVSNSNKNSSKASTKFTSHKRSLSHGSGSKTDAQFSGVTTKSSHSEELRSFKTGNDNSSTSKNIKQMGPKAVPVGEKVRIPNVVAKLMGLEELPLPNAEVKNCEVQKIPVSKIVTESSKIPIIVAENKNSEVQKVSKSKKVTEIGKTSILDAENKRVVDAVTYSEKSPYQMDNQKKVLQRKSITELKSTNTPEAVHSKGKTKVNDQNDMENINSAFKHSTKPHFNINNKQMDMTNMFHIKETRATKKEGAETGEATNVKEQTRKGKDESIVHDADKPFLEHDTQCTTLLPHTCHDGAVSKHELAQRKKDMPLEGKKNVREGLTIPSNQSNTINDKVPRQQSMVHRFKSKHTVHESPTGKEHNARNKPQVTVEKKGDQKLKNREKSPYDNSTRKVLSGSSIIVASKRGSTNTTDKDQLKDLENSHDEKQHTNNRSSTYHEVDRNSADGSLGERRTLKAEQITDKKKAMPPLLEAAIKKQAQIPSAQKVGITKVIAPRNKNNRNLEEEPRRIETSHANRQPLKNQTSFLHELEHRWKERTSKVEGTVVGSHAMNSEDHLQQKTAITYLSYSPLTDDCRKPRLADQRLAPDTNSHDVTITAYAAQQPPEISLKDDVEQQLVLNENRSRGPTDRMQHSNALSLQNQAISQVNGQGSLSKNEHLLKQILINSQHFLNTAQALFKLKIPVGVLQASEHVCADEGSKHVLDCGYEIMRRKGRREEVHFVKRVSSAPVKMRCLDALVKELNDDLESLKLPGKVDGDENDTAECLHKLLKRDIQNRNPDVNCMWDFGWNGTTFADTEIDEVIRDLEKRVLNGLINELARDLLNVGISI